MRSQSSQGWFKRFIERLRRWLLLICQILHEDAQRSHIGIAVVVGIAITIVFFFFTVAAYAFGR